MSSIDLSTLNLNEIYNKAVKYEELRIKQKEHNIKYKGEFTFDFLNKSNNSNELKQLLKLILNKKHIEKEIKLTSDIQEIYIELLKSRELSKTILKNFEKTKAKKNPAP